MIINLSVVESLAFSSFYRELFDYVPRAAARFVLERHRCSGSTPTILSITTPYLGKVVGAYTDWTPLLGRGLLFPEEMDRSDPWQFLNFRVD